MCHRSSFHYCKTIDFLLNARCKQCRHPIFHIFKYFNAHEYNAQTVLWQCKRYNFNSAHQYVNVMWTLNVPRVRLNCWSKLVCMYDMFLWVCLSAQIYPILILKEEIKGTLQIPKPAKGSHKRQVSNFPETKDGKFFVSVSRVSATRVHFALTEG